MKKVFLITITVVFLAGCGNSNTKLSATLNDGIAQKSSQQQSADCPHCVGSKKTNSVQGDVYASKTQCQVCKTTGKSPDNVARQNRKAVNTNNSNRKNSRPTISTPHKHSGQTAYEIRQQLDKLYQLLYDTRRNYENCTYGTLRTQYLQTIHRIENTISSLEAKLRNATR